MKAKDIKPRNSSDINADVIKTWKDAYPRGVWKLEVDSSEPDGTIEITDKKGRISKVPKFKQKVGFVRKPTRDELSAALTIKNDPLKQVEELLLDCWLGGDEELLKDEDLFQGAAATFMELMEISKGTLTKL
jgi:hypothetical protein